MQLFHVYNYFKFQKIYSGGIVHIIKGIKLINERSYSGCKMCRVEPNDNQ